MGYPDFDASNSVLQRWVMQLPRRYQGTLLAAARSCDVTPKPFKAGDGPVDRWLVAYLRFCFMIPADVRELDIPGAYMRRDPPPSAGWKPSELGHLPEHFYAHLMHAFQVVAEAHPELLQRQRAGHIYRAMVHNLHLNPETSEQFAQRLTEDRIASGSVVS